MPGKLADFNGLEIITNIYKFWAHNIILVNEPFNIYNIIGNFNV